MGDVVSSRAITIAGYVVCVLALVGLELASSVKGSRIPPFRDVIGRLMSTRSGRIAALTVWAWLGLHFFAR
jgi:Family of unknown function (DUF6186)